MTMVVVEITTLRDGETYKSTHRTDSLEEALRRAIKRGYGRGASLWMDTGLNTDPAAGTVYGQVTLPAERGGHTCITGRISVRCRYALDRRPRALRGLMAYPPNGH